MESWDSLESWIVDAMKGKFRVIIRELIFLMHFHLWPVYC